MKTSADTTNKDLTVREYLKQIRSEKNKGNTDSTKVIGGGSPIKPLRISDLKVPERSQRKFIKSHAENIYKNFEDNQFTPLIVSIRDGVYWVIDGQHRLYAVKKRFGGEGLVECKIITSLTEELECDLFGKINTNQKLLNSADKVKTDFYAGNPKIKALVDICNRNGVELGFENDNRGKKDGRIIAIKALADTYDKMGENQTERLVKLLNNTWDGNSEALSHSMIKAMSVILSLYGTELSDELWIKKLSKVEPSKLMSEAKSDLATKSNVPTKIARIAITNYYNKGRGAKPLPYKFSV